jgi:hypothetical protein
MKSLVVFAAAIATVVVAAASAHGRPQPQMFCWTPDVEFPVACEEEEDEDEGYRQLPVAMRVPWRGQPLVRVRPSSSGALASGAVG